MPSLIQYSITSKNVPKLNMPNCNNSLTILHLNIRSLNKNFDKLHEFLVSIRIRIDVICLTETRIKNDPLVYITIPQYKFCHVDSRTSFGGVAVYVSNNFTFKLCPNQYVMPNSECLWLELSTPNLNEKFTVGTVYRHSDHSTVNNFLDRFSDCLNDLSNSKKLTTFSATLISIFKSIIAPMLLITTLT